MEYMNFRKLASLLVIIIFTVNMSYAKNTLLLQEGMKIPQIEISYVENGRHLVRSTHSFAGTWLVLDCWSKYCSACIASFPQVDSLYRRYRGKVQVILLGDQDKEGQIEHVFNRYKAHFNLVVPYSFDSSILRRYEIELFPYTIIVDPQGIIRKITAHVTGEILEALFEGKNISTVKVYPNRTYENSDTDFLTKGNPFLNCNLMDTTSFRSLLSSAIVGWRSEGHIVLPRIEIADYEVKQGEFTRAGIGLADLYRYAYFGAMELSSSDSTRFGKYNYDLIVKVKNDSVFNVNWDLQQGLFAYTFRKANGFKDINEIEDRLRQDLDATFGFKSSLEIVAVPVFFLRLTDSSVRSSLATRYPNVRIKAKQEVPGIGMKMVNIPMWGLIYQIYAGNMARHCHWFIMDKTGIKGGVDLDLNCVWRDLDDVKRNLKEHGLLLEEGVLNMKAIVVRE